MKLTTLILASLIGFTSPAGAIEVRSPDPGGNLFQYVAKFKGGGHRIHARCYSACTVALHYPDTCAGPKAEFWFHAPRGTGRYDEVLKQMLMNYYPKNLRRWINSRGGLTKNKWIVLRGSEMRKLVRACS